MVRDTAARGMIQPTRSRAWSLMVTDPSATGTTAWKGPGLVTIMIVVVR